MSLQAVLEGKRSDVALVLLEEYYRVRSRTYHILKSKPHTTQSFTDLNLSHPEV